MLTSKVTVRFPCPVERVWEVMTDRTNTAWRSHLARVEVLDETHFVEYTKRGYATDFTVTACDPLCRWTFTMENGNMSRAWEGIFAATEGGAQLTCTETVHGKRWWMGPFVSGYLRRQQRWYLENLGRELQK